MNFYISNIFLKFKTFAGQSYKTFKVYIKPPYLLNHFECTTYYKYWPTLK